MTAHLPRLSADLDALVKRATARFEAMTPSQKLRCRYMQRRVFAKAFGGLELPHEITLSDAEIGLLMSGQVYA